VQPFLTQTAVRRLVPTIQGLVDHLINNIADGETIDFVWDFAVELSMSVMCAFVGVEKGDRFLFKKGGAAEAFFAGSSHLLSEDDEIMYARDLVAYHHKIADYVEDRLCSPSEDFIVAQPKAKNRSQWMRSLASSSLS
jgi:cytochrome P450